MISSIEFAAATVVPIFILIFIGTLLRATGIIDRQFITRGSKLVFNFALPAMVFSKMSAVENVPEGLSETIILFLAVTIIFFGLLWLCALRLPVKLHGSFVQGAFRGNIAIIGLAVTENAFGQQALQAAVVILMVMMPVYNFLAIIVLGRNSGGSDTRPIKTVAVNLVKNPLIWAIAVGLLFGIYKIPVPSAVDRTLSYLSQLTMPLALISIGGSLTLSGLVKRKLLWISAAAVKLVVIPLAVWLGTLVLGITGNAQNALVVLSACPAAVSGFAMAEAMGADSELAGEIISATTLLSIITVSFWIVLLI